MQNVNPATGIRYGVLSGHNAPLLLEEIYQNGTDETFAAHKADCVRQLAALLDELGQRDAKEKAEEIVDEFEWDNYLADETDYSYTDSDGNRFQLSHLGGAPLIWCLQTNTVVHVRSLCSPCVPNAGDLDSGNKEDGWECYGIPADYVETAE